MRLSLIILLTAGPPILSNPSLTNNATHFTLMWSPPFLWPGHRIQYYNISITNKTDGSMKHHRVDTSFCDSLVAFSIRSLNTPSMLSCMEIVFSISAFDGSSSEQIQIFNISDWLWIFPSSKPYACYIVPIKVSIFGALMISLLYLSFFCVY